MLRVVLDILRLWRIWFSKPVRGINDHNRTGELEGTILGRFFEEEAFLRRTDKQRKEEKPAHCNPM